MQPEELFQTLRDIRATQLTQAESNGRIEVSLSALAGPEGRVTKLEKSATRQWWLNVAVLPIIASLHSIARKMGY